MDAIDAALVDFTRKLAPIFITMSQTCRHT
jgi:hypothetical protein